MSRYNNVNSMLIAAENYNLDELVSLLDIPCSHLGSDAYDKDLLDLAEDLGFVLVSMWAMVPEDKKMTFRDRLTDEIVNVEIKEMFYGEEE